MIERPSDAAILECLRAGVFAHETLLKICLASRYFDQARDASKIRRDIRTIKSTADALEESLKP